MARSVKRLTALKVGRLNEPGQHADGNGLYLEVGKTGGKSWTYIYNRMGKRTQLGLGPVHAVSLAQAREKALEAASLRAQGIDPKTHWRAEKNGVPTFGQVAIDLITGWEQGWKSKKHAAQWRSTLTTYARPIWDKPVDEVCVEDILSILRPIWTIKEETASRVRGRVEEVLNAAKVRGLRSGENPAAWRGHLSLLLPRRRKGPKQHHPAMPHADLPAFMVRLKARAGSGARALECPASDLVRQIEGFR